MTQTTTTPLQLRDDTRSQVSIAADDRPLLTYTYAADDAQLESPRPYVHPIHTLGGDLVSMLRPHDHVWHKGIAWSLPNVGPDNFWGGATYLRDGGYQQLPNNGSMRHERVVDSGQTSEGAYFEHELAWVTEPGATIIRERRRLEARITDAADAWVLRWDTAMTNESGSTIQIGSPTTEGRENAGYGGLFWRGPRSFTGGALLSPDGPGGEELRGRRYPWMGFTGQHDGVGGFSTIVIVDHDDNPRHPPEWFARSEIFGCLNPAPFFSEEFEFEAGATVEFRYAVVVSDGAADQSRADDLAAAGREALKRAAA